MSTLPAALRADCSRCAGLCCVVPAFYATQGFGFDKPAHTPCIHLTSAGRCSIHSERAARGFPGCVHFDCYGAGQRVTQEVLEGTSRWHRSRETAAWAFSAYVSYLALHRLMAALALSEAAACPVLAQKLRAKREQLDELCRTEDARSGLLDIASLRAETASLLREAVGLAPPTRETR
jgi:hypothetical protein